MHANAALSLTQNRQSPAKETLKKSENTPMARNRGKSPGSGGFAGGSCRGAWGNGSGEDQKVGAFRIERFQVL